MATSGSVDFSQTCAEIIEDALSLVNGIDDDETPSAHQLASARRALNRLCKAWMKRGLKLWLQEEATLDLVDGQASYTLGVGGNKVMNRPLEIYNVRWTDGTNEIPVLPFSRQEYFEQVNKTAEGKPVRFYYDPQLTLGAIYFWPTPDSSTDDVKFNYRTPVEDFDAQGNDPYFPQEWLHALVTNLATQIYHLGAVDAQRRAEIKAEAVEALAFAEAYDNDDTSMFLAPRR